MNRIPLRFAGFAALAALGPSVHAQTSVNPKAVRAVRVAEAHESALPPAALRYVRQGDAELGSGNFTGAASLYARAAAEAPGALLPRLLLGVALSSAGQTKLAVDQLRQARRIAEDDLLTAFLLIGALEAYGDPAGSQDLYLQTVRDPRFRPPGRSGFDASGSLARLRSASLIFPRSPVVALLLGDALQLADSPVDAESAYRLSLRLAPRWIKPRVNLARLQIAEGGPGLAVETLEGALRQDPGNIAARTTLGEALVRAGRPKEAIVTVQRLEHVESASVLSVLAQASLGEGRLDDARKYGARLQKSAPNDPSARVVQGEVLKKQGDFGGAADAFGQALKLTRASGLFDAQPSLLRSLAEAQLSAGRPADALLTVKEALDAEPDLAAIWHRLAAQSHEALGDRIAMEDSLRAALDAERSLVPADTLAALERRSLIEKTLAYYRTQLSIARTGVGASALGGGVSVAGGSVSKAAEVRCLAALGHLYRFQSDLAQEISVRRDLCAIRGAGLDWFLLAEAQERQGERADALASYRQALRRGGLSSATTVRAQARIKSLSFRP